MKALILSAGLAAGVLPVQAQEPAHTVKVEAAKKHGEVAYRAFHRGQQMMRSWQQPEPRLLDFWYRASYADMAPADVESYLPDAWGVSILSASIDQVVPMRRGGYFHLPELPQALKEDAVVLFREPNRRGRLEIAWLLRVGSGRKMSYGTLARALEEIRGVQARASVLSPRFWQFKYYRYDAVQACFLDADGAILVDGQPVVDDTVGNCKRIRIDPGRFASEAQVEFAGAFDSAAVVGS